MKTQKLSDHVLAVALGVSALLAILLVAPQSFGQDVYNFYWQKAAGPKTVIQGGRAPQGVEHIKIDEAAEPAAASTAPASTSGVVSAPISTAVAPTSAMKTEVAASQVDSGSKFRHWAIGAGVGAASGGLSENGTAEGRYVVSGQYHFNRYIGIDLTVGFGGPDGNRAEGDDSSRQSSSSSKTIMPSLGLVLTPINIDLFGMELVRFGVAGGVNHASWETEDRRLQPYLGGLIGFNLGENISIDYMLRGTLTSNGTKNREPGGFHSIALAYHF